MAKKSKIVFVKQMSEGQMRLGTYEGYYGCGEATFSKSGETCYFEDKTLKKIKGGRLNEATHRNLEDGNDYLVKEVTDCDKDYRKLFIGKFLKKTRKL
ncbi:MAG: hypothetical protein ACYS9Y_08975 [Planctomycetota bacterium]|jgi:hypothetical protein